MKRAYYYLFYKFYKMSEAAPSRWWSEWKASLLIDLLIFIFVFSCILYYNIFFDRNFKFENVKLIVLIYLLLIAAPNYFIFHHHDQWKEIVAKFDQLPRRKNRIGSWIVFAVVLFVIANLIFSFYLMSRVDWSQYR